ncbi:MAG: GerW family sporulation protein [Clostridia bacterium]|nr:GerW family sporulation protein [Clostridia bacterium]
MADNQIDKIIASAIEKIKAISDVKTVVGEPIEIGEVLIIPISKLSLGFVAGGGEYGTDKNEIKMTKSYPFSGGSGGGVCVNPIGFLCVHGKDVKFIKTDGKTPYEKILETIPKVIESVCDGIKEDKKSK